jgi:diphthine synthase
MNAVGAAGLQLYNFGATVSLCFWRDEWRPDSYYDKVAYNAAGGMHTLMLLDIKVREPDFRALVTTGRTVHLAPRFMTINEAAEQLMEAEEARGGRICGPDALAVGLARVGHADQLIVSGRLSDLARVDWGGPLHSLVLVGPHPHEVESAMLATYAFVEGVTPLNPDSSDGDSTASNVTPT